MELYLLDTIPNFKNNFFTKPNLAFYFKKIQSNKGKFFSNRIISKLKKNFLTSYSNTLQLFWENLSMEETQKKIIINVII